MRHGVRYTWQAARSWQLAGRGSCGCPLPAAGRRLVDNPFNEPVIGIALAEQAIGRAVVERDVPFVAIPGGQVGRVGLGPTCPPAARRAPGAGTRLDAAAAQPASIRGHARRLRLLHAHARDDGEPESAERHAYDTPRR